MSAKLVLPAFAGVTVLWIFTDNLLLACILQNLTHLSIYE